MLPNCAAHHHLHPKRHSLGASDTGGCLSLKGRKGRDLPAALLTLSFRQSSNAQIRAQPGRKPRDFRAGLSGVPWVTPWGATHSLAGGKGEVSVLCSPALLIAIQLLSEVEQGRARWGVRAAPEVYKPQGRFAPGSAFRILTNRTCPRSQGQPGVVHRYSKTALSRTPREHTTATDSRGVPQTCWGAEEAVLDTLRTAWSPANKGQPRGRGPDVRWGDSWGEEGGHRIPQRRAGDKIVFTAMIPSRVWLSVHILCKFLFVCDTSV